MSRARRRSTIAAVPLALAVVAVLAIGGGDRARPERAQAKRFVPGLTPLRTERRGNSTYAYYSADPGSMLPSSHAKERVPRKVTARVAAAEQAATFSVLDEPQTAAEAGDPILALVAKDRPDVAIGRAKALDPGRKYWLMPTDDGQVCLGQKTTGVRIFALACGYDDTVARTGLAQRVGDDLVAVVPDGAREARDSDGSALRIDCNLLIARRAGGASFRLDGRTRRLR